MISHGQLQNNSEKDLIIISQAVILNSGVVKTENPVIYHDTIYDVHLGESCNFTIFLFLLFFSSSKRLIFFFEEMLCKQHFKRCLDVFCFILDITFKSSFGYLLLAKILFSLVGCLDMFPVHIWLWFNICRPEASLSYLCHRVQMITVANIES